MDMKRFFLGFIMMIAVAMVGCGGGGGTTTPPLLGAPPPAPPPAVNLMKLLTGYKMIPATGLTFEIKAGETHALGNYVVFSCPAGGAACKVTVMRNADGTIKGATSAGGLATAAPSQMAQDAYAAKMGRISAIGTHHAANVPSKTTDTLPTLPLKATGDAATEITLADGGDISVVEGPTGTRVTDRLGKDDDGTGATSDIADANEFMMQSNPTFPPIAISGWAASVYERTNDDADKTMDMLTIYSDVEDPADAAYLTYFADGNAGTEPGNRPAVVTSMTDTGAAGVFEAGDGVLSLSNVAATVAAHSGLFDSTVFAFQKDGRVHEVTFSGNTTNDANKFAGMFNGVSGHYVCGNATDGCTATSDTKGNLAGLSANWTFEPTEAGAKGMVEGVTPDDDYLAFGYWVRTTPGAAGMSYDVSAFARGNEVFTEANVAGLAGKAEYAGPAAGLFAKRTFSADGTPTVTAAGEFTATAMLTAYFGQLTDNSIAPNRLFSISGTVTNFMDATGAMIDESWKLDLMRTMFADNTTGTNATNTFTGDTAVMGDDTVNGKWTGMFYSNGAEVTDHPGSVAGEFGARFTNGELLGAFGAKNTK